MLLEHIIFPIIGWTFLRIKYRNQEVRKSVLDQKYAGSYGAAGSIIALDGCALAGAISLGLILVLMIGMVIWKLLSEGVDGLSTP